MQEEERV